MCVSVCPPAEMVQLGGAHSPATFCPANWPYLSCSPGDVLSATSRSCKYPFVIHLLVLAACSRCCRHAVKSNGDALRWWKHWIRGVKPPSAEYDCSHGALSRCFFPVYTSREKERLSRWFFALGRAAASDFIDWAQIPFNCERHLFCRIGFYLTTHSLSPLKIFYLPLNPTFHQTRPNKRRLIGFQESFKRSKNL